MSSTPSIPQFFSEKNIFITGATGFLGKALIEKLLRSCPQIGDIYILVRPKRGKNLDERVQLLIDDPVYERVKQEQPNLDMKKKILPLEGDIKEINLGLSPEDRNMLIEKVNIIFHVAASVRFDDPLHDAVMLNIRGTREACQLALDAKHLVGHIHVSTAFVNCDRPEVEEILYPSKMDWKNIIEIAEKFDKDTLAVLTQKILDGMPNTYCFTKGIAEHVAYDMMLGKKPCKIFRPSIVISAMKDEPFKGWIDNFNGPVGILVAYGKGSKTNMFSEEHDKFLLEAYFRTGMQNGNEWTYSLEQCREQFLQNYGIMRTIYSAAQYKPDYIPVDVVTKALVVSTWELCTRVSITSIVPVPELIHATSHSADWLRPNAETLATIAISANRHTPLNGCLWVPEGHSTGSVMVWYVRTLLTMLLPSLVVDGVLMIAGKKPILTKLQKKIFVAQLALRYFMNNDWDYHNNKLLALQSRIQEADKPSWDYEFHDYNFAEYMNHSILGARRYLLNEPDSTLDQARKHYQRMWWISKIVWVLFVGLCLWGVWKVGVVSSGVKVVRL